VSRVPAPEGFVAVVSHSHLDADTESFLAKLKIAKRSSAGSSLKFLLIARGEADVYPRFGPTMEWDIAAGQAVLEAAGGIVVDTEGAAPPLWQGWSSIAQSKLHRLGPPGVMSGVLPSTRLTAR
jgi:3'(2'), 5'-bisphosphate nucleotidase